MWTGAAAFIIILCCRGRQTLLFVWGRKEKLCQSVFIRNHPLSLARSHFYFLLIVHFNETRHGCCSTEIINIFPILCHTGRIWSTLSPAISKQSLHFTAFFGVRRYFVWYFEACEIFSTTQLTRKLDYRLKVETNWTDPFLWETRSRTFHWIQHWAANERFALTNQRHLNSPLTNQLSLCLSHMWRMSRNSSSSALSWSHMMIADQWEAGVYPCPVTSCMSLNKLGYN